MIGAMADRLTHILDEDAPEDGVRQLGLLLERIPASEARQRLVVIGRTPPTLTVPGGVHTVHIGRRFDSPLVTALGLRRLPNGGLAVILIVKGKHE